MHARPVSHRLQHGRMAWQKASGYNRRARAEAAINRYKRVIGAALRSRTDQRRATEVAIAVEVLNCMLALDARIMSASPETRQGWSYCACPSDPCNTVLSCTS